MYQEYLKVRIVNSQEVWNGEKTLGNDYPGKEKSRIPASALCALFCILIVGQRSKSWEPAASRNEKSAILFPWPHR
jgi:hypothetical protein